MGTHTEVQVDKERLGEIWGSIEFFIMVLVLLSVLGFVFLAAV